MNTVKWSELCRFNVDRLSMCLPCEVTADGRVIGTITAAAPEVEEVKGLPEGWVKEKGYMPRRVEDRLRFTEDRPPFVWQRHDLDDVLCATLTRGRPMNA